MCGCVLCDVLYARYWGQRARCIRARGANFNGYEGRQGKSLLPFSSISINMILRSIYIRTCLEFEAEIQYFQRDACFDFVAELL